jgi:ribosome recycling factor
VISTLEYLYMAYNISEFTTRADDVLAWLAKEFTGVRTGRAAPALLDLVHVEAYGSKMPINQVGSVMVEDPRTLRVSVWDASMIRSVEKGVTEADLGVSVVVDGAGLRVIFPPLTSERRVQLLKLAKAKLEEARVSIRSIRDDAMKSLDTLEKDGEMSKDEKFTAREQVQKRVDEYNAKLESLYDAKEKEINE